MVSASLLLSITTTHCNKSPPLIRVCCQHPMFSVATRRFSVFGLNQCYRSHVYEPMVSSSLFTTRSESTFGKSTLHRATRLFTFDLRLLGIKLNRSVVTQSCSSRTGDLICNSFVNHRFVSASPLELDPSGLVCLVEVAGSRDMLLSKTQPFSLLLEALSVPVCSHCHCWLHLGCKERRLEMSGSTSKALAANLFIHFAAFPLHAPIAQLKLFFCTGFDQSTHALCHPFQRENFRPHGPSQGVTSVHETPPDLQDAVVPLALVKCIPPYLWAPKWRFKTTQAGR